MSAARVRPESRRVVLAGRATLKEKAALLIEQEHRHRAMQRGRAVGVELRRRTDLPVVRIDQHDHLLRRNRSQTLAVRCLSNTRIPNRSIIMQQLRHAWRSLLRTPVFTVAAVLTLVIGMAAVLSIFAV